MMSLQEKINQDLKNAMLLKDEFKRNLLRVVIGEFNRVDKNVSDEKAFSILKKMIENAKQTGNENEIVILSEYLPKQMTIDELKNVISVIIKNKNYSNKDIGKIMNDLKTSYGGKYDGKLASDIIKTSFA